MTDIVINLEFLGIMIAIVITLIVGYFCCMRPCMMDNPKPDMVIECPRCGRWLSSEPKKSYYCKDCNKTYRRVRK